eukprot:213556-Amphidinium_carterae.1
MVLPFSFLENKAYETESYDEYNEWEKQIIRLQRFLQTLDFNNGTSSPIWQPLLQILAFTCCRHRLRIRTNQNNLSEGKNKCDATAGSTTTFKDWSANVTTHVSTSTTSRVTSTHAKASTTKSNAH